MGETNATVVGPPEVGKPAPLFKASVTGDGDFELAAQAGKWVVIYFFPRSNTPG